MSAHIDSTRAQGLKTYQGVPCKRGHTGERYTSTRDCAVCKAERARQRHAANPERAREQGRAWRAAHPEQVRERDVAYRAAHPEQVRERDVAYRAAHREKERERNAAYRAAHPEQVRESRRKWDATNPGATRAKCAKRRALKITQRCTCCTDAEIQKIYDIAALCGAGAHVDHIVQLSLGGPHCAKNLEALTAEAHIEKTKLDAAVRADSRRRNQTAAQLENDMTTQKWLPVDCNGAQYFIPIHPV